MFKRIGRDLGCLRGSTPHWLNWDKTHSLTPEILATVEHLHSGGLAATLSVPLVRQHGQRVKLDSFLMQLLGLVRRGLAVNRAALDLARKVCSCLQETHSIPPARKRAGYVDS